MSLDLTIITSTPAVLRNQLIARNIIKDDGNGNLVGVRPGVEITYSTVPNPIVATPATGTLGEPGYAPAVMDARKVYLVRLSHEANADDDDGTATQPDDPTPRLSRSKLVKWIIANSVAQTLTSADGKTYRTRRVGTTLWFVLPADAERFGVWQ